MARAKYFAWIDLETTGVDEDLDPILEVGMIITRTSAPFEELFAGQWVIDPTSTLFPGWRERLRENEFVQNMHTVNGLLDDVGKSDVAVSLDVAEKQMINALDFHGRPHNYMLAGSGVGHFDRRFIATQMPTFDTWLQYPNLDVGVLRRAFSFAGRSDLDAFGSTFEGSDKPHRGLPDVRDHLAEFRAYCEIFQAIPTLLGSDVDA